MRDFTTVQTELRDKGIILSLDEQGKLTYDAPQGAMTLALKSDIRDHKQNFLDLLENVPTTKISPPLHCRGCHETRVEYWKFNLFRNRWVCCNCGKLAPLLHSYPVEVIAA